MKELVSKNPIQRFKQGKVIKAQSGAPVYKNAYYEVRDSQGNIIERGRRTTGRPNQVYKEVINNNLPNINIVKTRSKNSTQQTPYPNGYYTNKKSTTVAVKKPKIKGIRKKTTPVVEPAKPIVPVETTIPQEQRVASVVPNIPAPPTQITVERTPVTYDRAQTRDIMRMMGYNPYSFTGAQRKQLRQYLNGESDDTSLLSNIDLSKFRNDNIQPSETPSTATPTFVPSNNKPLIFNGGLWKGQISDILGLSYAKQGGKLISRNPVKQFKQK